MAATDNTGTEVLNVIAEAKGFNKWIYQTIKPLIRGNTLEIGSGIGNISTFFLSEKYPLSLSDTEEKYIDILTTKFKGNANLIEILLIDLELPNFETSYSSLKGKYDSVFLLNVLEHIKDDTTAIRNINFLLKPGGAMVILTPAYSFLFSNLDRSLGHYRRYTKKSLTLRVKSSNFIIKEAFYFNCLGIGAWLYAKFLGLKRIPQAEMGIYNKLVPVAKLLDKICFNKIGLSVILVGKKKSNQA